MMTVKVVTDSSADLPAALAEELGITVVPLYVRFGNDVYRDRVDISVDDFYRRLLSDPVHPSTVQPSPQDFADVYKKLSKEADGIVSIHISSKLSGTCGSALQGREMVGGKCPIEVVDSEQTTMGLGLVVIKAAELARAGKDLAQVMAEVKKVLPHIYLLGFFDTLKYLALGGRIGKAKALLGSVLNVKPLLSLKEGEVVPAGQARTRAKGIDRLFEFAKGVTDIQDMAIMYNTIPDEPKPLAERLDSVFPKKKIRIAQLGPVLGVHCGPGIIFVVVIGKKAGGEG
jgi:DegV family protein with EDD domain